VEPGHNYLESTIERGDMTGVLQNPAMTAGAGLPFFSPGRPNGRAEFVAAETLIQANAMGAEKVAAVVKEGKVEGVRASEVEVQPLLKAGVLGVMHAGRNTEQKVERHLFEAEADREDGSLGVKQIVGDTKGRAYDDGDGLALN
jgi:hypothetical protein